MPSYTGSLATPRASSFLWPSELIPMIARSADVPSDLDFLNEPSVALGAEVTFFTRVHHPVIDGSLPERGLVFTVEAEVELPPCLFQIPATHGGRDPLHRLRENKNPIAALLTLSVNIYSLLYINTQILIVQFHSYAMHGTYKRLVSGSIST